MTVLEIASEIASELAILTPQSLVNSTDAVGKQFRAIMDETAEELISVAPWPELLSRATITLLPDTRSYSLPISFSRFANDTLWNNDSKWPLTGPITPQDFELETVGVVGVYPWQRFRLSNFYTGFGSLAPEQGGEAVVKIDIVPTPTADEAGQTLTFEFYQNRAFRPKFWVTGTTYTANTFVFVNLEASSDPVYLYTLAGGTSGGDIPQSSNGYNDGGLQWSVYTGAYNKIRKDSDEVILDQRLFKLGVKWRFAHSRGLDYTKYEESYRERLARLVGHKTSATILYLDGDIRREKGPRIRDSGIGFL